MALIREAKAAVEDPTAPNKQLRLAQAAKAVSQALNQVGQVGGGEGRGRNCHLLLLLSSRW